MALQRYISLISAQEENGGANLCYKSCTLDARSVEVFYEKAVVVPGFISATTNADIARGLLQQDLDGEECVGVLFEITATVMCPANIAGFSKHNEVLLPAWSTFTVESVNRVLWGAGSYLRICLTQQRDAASVPVCETAEPEVVAADGGGPEFDASAVVEELERRLHEMDKGCQTELMSDGSRVWGRCWMSQTDLAEIGVRTLKGARFGDRVLNVRLAPAPTDAVALRARVKVVVSAVPHTGLSFRKVFLKIFTPNVVALRVALLSFFLKILQQKENLFSPKVLLM